MIPMFYVGSWVNVFNGNWSQFKSSQGIIHVYNITIKGQFSSSISLLLLLCTLIKLFILYCLSLQAILYYTFGALGYNPYARMAMVS